MQSRIAHWNRFWAVMQQSANKTDVSMPLSFIHSCSASAPRSRTVTSSWLFDAGPGEMIVLIPIIVIALYAGVLALLSR